MTKLIINTNEIVSNDGTLNNDVVTKKDDEVSSDKLLKEINRKLDLLLKEKEEAHG